MATKKKGAEADSTAKGKTAQAKQDPADQAGSKEAGPPAKANQAKKEAGKEASGQQKSKPKNGNDKAQKAQSKESSKKKDEESALSESLKDIRQFLKEVAIEFKKISWPDRSQVVRETYSVLFLVTIITVMVLGFDWVLGHAVFGPLEHWARLHGGGVGRG